MNQQRSFALQTLIATLVLNGILLAVLFFLLQEPIQRGGLTITYWAIGGTITFILWLITMFTGRRALEGEAIAAAASARSAAEAAAKATGMQKNAQAAPPKPVEAAKPQRAPTASAIQMLSILQRQGRLIDFLQEDLSLFDDAQIGSAVRNIHAGCKQALSDHVQIEPVFAQPEGSKVTVPPGFDAAEIRLSGHVSGDPPFTGTLQHRGWRVTQISLPEQVGGDKSTILAAAEVEL